MSNKITHATRLTVLKHLAGGKNADLVAKIMKLSRYEIIDIGSEHGYPDVTKMARGVEQLTREIEASEREDLAARPLAGPDPFAQRPAAPASRPSAIPAAARPTTAPAAPAVPASERPQVLTQPDELRVLINAGKQSKSKRVQALTDRIIDDLARLKESIRAEQAKAEEARHKAEPKAAAARARAAERAELEKKMADLEAELASVKAKLRGPKTTISTAPSTALDRTTSPASATSSAGSVTPAKEIRGLARAAGLEVPVTGRVPQSVREAYAAAHADNQAA